jgi:flagellin
MGISVHTNQSALIALQNLNATNEKLNEVQGRISTGLRIANAKDNAAVWSIAQDQRADIGAMAAVKMSLDRASSVAEVTMTAGESVSDLLVQIKEKVVAAMDPSIAANSRASLNSDFKALLRQIAQVVDSAEFNGANILNGSLASDIRFLANETATNFITLSVKNMTLGSSIITMAATASIGSAGAASAVMALVDASLSNVNSALGDIGAQAKQISNHNTFVAKLTDVLTTGVGNLVDADLAKEGARLQALQVQQQLGAQALSIANTAPQIILSLFRGG